MEQESMDLLGKYCFYDGCRGIVRFVGVVDGMKSTYLGVEWDSRKRGKHNGSYNGKIYFECNPGCGSFIKPEKVIFETTIEEALHNRYSKDNNRPTDMTLFNATGIIKRYVQVELVGIEERIDDYLNMGLKTFINMDGMGISSSGSKNMNKNFANLLPQLEQLNLAYNLLTDFNEVFAIIEGCEKLNYLNLNKNLLDFNTLNNKVHQNNTIKCLTLCEMNNLKWEDVEKLLQCFTAVEELILAYSDIAYIDINMSNIELYKKLKHLDLSGNKLKDWTLIEPLANLPNLKTLVLRENRLKTINVSKMDEKYFASLECLNLCENVFNTLQDIVQLTPINSLVDLRLNGNPLLYKNGSNDNFDKVWCEIIAFFPNVQKLNSTNIDERERRNAEIWFIKNRMETYQIDDYYGNIERCKDIFNNLIEKYQIKPESKTQQNTTLRNHLYHLNLRYLSYESKIQVPKDLKVRHLKTLAEKVLKTEIYCNEINFISSKTQQLNKIIYYNHDLTYNEIGNDDTILFTTDCVSPK